MQVIFVGTGSGAVSLERYHSSFIITTGTFNCLVDCGDSISRALLNASIEYNSINAILITHLHSDHLNGISSLITQMRMKKRKIPLELYIHKNLAEFLEEFLYINYIVEERMDFDIHINCFDTNEQFSLDVNLSMCARENSHVEKYSRFDIKKEHLTSSSILIHAEGKKIFYTGDVGSTQDLYLFKDKTVDYIISETTHVLPEDIIGLYNTSRPKHTFLTHINVEEQEKLFAWYNLLDLSIRDKVTLVKDGQHFEL